MSTTTKRMSRRVSLRPGPGSSSPRPDPPRKRTSLSPRSPASGPAAAAAPHGAGPTDPASGLSTAAKASVTASAPSPSAATSAPDATQPNRDRSSQRRHPTGRAATESLVQETKSILGALDPLASSYHPRYRASSNGRPSSHQPQQPQPQQQQQQQQQQAKENERLQDLAPSLAAFKAQLLARSAPVFPSSTRRSSLPGSAHSASRSGAVEESPASAAQVDWQMYRDWPEGLALEEEAVHTYFQRLKFIFLEQATKLTFLNDCHEDPETGKEGVVHDLTSVRALEEKAVEAKTELAQAKSQVRQVRSEIDDLVHGLAQPWAKLESQANEAQQLMGELADMELELAKIRATSGRTRRRSSGTQAKGCVSAQQPENSDGSQRVEGSSLGLSAKKDVKLLKIQDDVEMGQTEVEADKDMEEDDTLPGTADVDATVPPPLGTLTVPEAEAFCEAQLERMQDLASETEKFGEQSKEAESALKHALRRAERKANERKSTEANLEEMRAGARDLRIEQLCTSRGSLLHLLRSALGVAQIASPSPSELHITYSLPLPGIKIPTVTRPEHIKKQSSSSEHEYAEAEGKTENPPQDAVQPKQVKLVLTYHDDGGMALDHYCIVNPSDDSDTELDYAHVAQLDAASEANQPTALVHGLWSAMLQYP